MLTPPKLKANEAPSLTGAVNKLKHVLNTLPGYGINNLPFYDRFITDENGKYAGRHPLYLILLPIMRRIYFTETGFNEDPYQ